MDHRKAKRPRSGTPTKGAEDMTSFPLKKKSKNKKKSKRKASEGGEASQQATSSQQTKRKPSLEDTATADGQIMARLLSTLNKLEQSRFEAYQRSSVDGNVVESWIVACLKHCMQNSEDAGGGENSSGNSSGDAAGSLMDFCASADTADEIVAVVSQAAKTYAQRLVAAAVQQQQNSENNGHYQPQAPLSPEHVLLAHEAATRRGTDPGFYFQSHEPWNLEPSSGGRQGSSSGAAAAAQTSVTYEQQRLATLAAQEAYEEHVKQAAAEEPSPENQERNDGDGPMESPQKQETTAATRTGTDQSAVQDPDKKGDNNDANDSDDDEDALLEGMDMDES